MTEISIKPNPDIKQIITDFQDRSGLRDVEYEIKQRSDGQALILHVANPTERFFKILTSVAETKALEGMPTPTIKKASPC